MKRHLLFLSGLVACCSIVIFFIVAKKRAERQEQQAQIAECRESKVETVNSLKGLEQGSLKNLEKKEPVKWIRYENVWIPQISRGTASGKSGRCLLQKKNGREHVAVEVTRWGSREVQGYFKNVLVPDGFAAVEALQVKSLSVTGSCGSDAESDAQRNIARSQLLDIVMSKYQNPRYFVREGESQIFAVQSTVNRSGAKESSQVLEYYLLDPSRSGEFFRVKTVGFSQAQVDAMILDLSKNLNGLSGEAPEDELQGCLVSL